MRCIRIQIREIMRVLLYTIMLLTSSCIFAQQGTPANNSNGNNNNISVPTMETVEEVEMDTTAEQSITPASARSSEKLERKEIQSKEIQTQGKSKATKKVEAEQEMAPVEDMKIEGLKDAQDKLDDAMPAPPSPPAPSIAKAAEMKNVSTGFSTTNLDSDMQRSSRSPSLQQQVQMDQAVNYFQENAPSSFEYHYFKYVAGNYNVDLYTDLQAAAQVRPDNADVHVQLAGYFMINNQVDTALIYVDKLLESDRLTDNVVAYSGDILRSVQENGTLITHGFDDGFGSYYALNQQGIRSDVTLVSLDFLQSEAYRADLKTKGYKLPTTNTVDVNYLANFCALNVDKNLSVSLTTPKEYFQTIQDKLFVVGLVFEYHSDGFDNFTRNEYLWNESLEKSVISNPMDEKGKQLSANYLPMLLHLRKVYQVTGEKSKLKEVDEVSDQIGVQSRKYEQVQKVKASY